MGETLAWIVAGLAAVPVMMAAGNGWLFRRLPRVDGMDGEVWPSVSVLIPARNEAARIGGALESVRASEGVTLEIIVLDDRSTDDTARIVERSGDGDGRVRLLRGKEPPAGWSGKQHACQQLADAASHEVLVWLDADVRLEPDALRRAAAALSRSRAGLISGFPRQVTGTWSERQVVPMMHVLLLGYLPMLGMRLTRLPGFAAGCGQFMLAKRKAYDAVGGHGAIAESFHDGITLPRAFREAGFFTDIFDATDVATCRMYESFRELWWGFLKNADEGMATPIGLPVWTVLLLGGHVLPWLLLMLSLGSGMAALPAAPVWLACGCAGGLSVWVAGRYGYGWRSAAERPIGVVLLLAIQWHALVRHRLGRPRVWRGRGQPSTRAAS